MDEVNIAEDCERNWNSICWGICWNDCLNAIRVFKCRSEVFSRAEYGVFSLALTILSVALVMMGFPNSLPREVAFYREKEASKIGSLISTTLAIVSLTSLAVTLFLVSGSAFIAQVFKRGEVDLRFEDSITCTSFFSPNGNFYSHLSGGLEGLGRRFTFRTFFIQSCGFLSWESLLF